MKNRKIEKILSIVSITGLFIVVGVLALAFTQVIPFSVGLVDFLLIVGIICLVCLLNAPVAKMLSENKKNIFAYIDLGISVVCGILWIVFVIIGQDFILSFTTNVDSLKIIRVLNYFRVISVITLQSVVYNLIVIYVHYFKKRMLVFQIVMYISNFIVDLWLSLLLVCINTSNGQITFTNTKFLFSKAGLAIFIMALGFTVVSSAVIKSKTNRRNREKLLSDIDGVNNESQNKDKNNEQKINEQTLSVEEKIKKLNDLKDKNLITEEEYKEKKSKLLEEL